jgi:hypothetical protein
MKTVVPILCKTSLTFYSNLFLLFQTIFFIQPALCQSPGGVNSGLYLWLKADVGVIQSSGNVSQWTNQASTSMATQVSKTASSNVTLVSNGINIRPVIRFAGTESMRGTYTTTPTQPALIFAVALGRSGTGQQYLGDVYSNSPGGAMGMIYDATTGRYSVDLSGAACSASPVNLNQPSLVRVYYQNASGNSPSAASGSYTAINGIQNTVCGSDGKLVAPTGNIEIGGRTWDVGGRYFVGDIAEVIYYNSNTATTAQINQVESYLAFKYGISLGSTTAVKNYAASDGTIFWTANSTYQNNVFGIGTDNGSGLVVTQANSINTGNGDGSGQNGKGNLYLSVSSALSDKQFLTLGDDAGSLNEQTSNVPLTYGGSSRVGRTWKVKKTGSVGAVSLSLDMTGLSFTGGTDRTKYRLMINTNGSSDFTTGTPVFYAPVSVTSNKINFTGVNLADNSVFTVITNSTVPLPVTWVNFSSGLKNGVVTLKWKTADEIDVENYVVEHSANGTSYDAIATIFAKGSSGLNEYEYAYKEQSGGAHYYRIKEVDINGNYKYSLVRTVVVGNTFVLQIQSNPVYQSLSIIVNSDANTKAKLQVVNTEGKVLINHDEILCQGKNVVKMHADKLPQGMYFLRAAIGADVLNIKFLKLAP